MVNVAWMWSCVNKKDRGIILNRISHHSPSQTESHSPSLHHICIYSFPSVQPASMWASCHIGPDSSDWYEGISPEAEGPMIYSCPNARFIKTQSVNPLEELKDVVCHWLSLVCSYVLLPLWGTQPWSLISQPDQITQPGITERMLRLWFSTPPFWIYSCASLQAANYGLSLIIWILSIHNNHSQRAYFINLWEYDQLGKKKSTQVSQRSVQLHSNKCWNTFSCRVYYCPPIVWGSLKPTVAQPSVSLVCQ